MYFHSYPPHFQEQLRSQNVASELPGARLTLVFEEWQLVKNDLDIARKELAPLIEATEPTIVTEQSPDQLSELRTMAGPLLAAERRMELDKELAVDGIRESNRLREPGQDACSWRITE